MTGPDRPSAQGRPGRLALGLLLFTTLAVAAARIGMALADGTITDKHGQAWARAADPGHFWLLMIPWITMLVVPAGVVIALLLGAGHRPR